MIDEAHFDPLPYLNIKCSRKFTHCKYYQYSAQFKKFAKACPHSSRKIIKLRQYARSIRMSQKPFTKNMTQRAQVNKNIQYQPNGATSHTNALKHVITD